MINKKKGISRVLVPFIFVGFLVCIDLFGKNIIILYIKKSKMEIGKNV